MKIVINNRNPMYAGPWGFLAQVIVMTLAALLAAWVIPPVEFSSVGVAVLTAIVIALLNNFIRPILIVLALPFMIFTLGLFLFVINAVIVVFADALIPGFETGGFGYALLFSVLLTVFNYLLELPNRLMRRPRYEQHSNMRNRNDDEEFAEYEEIKDDEEK